MEASYFIATLASARAAGMFGGGNGPASTSTKVTLSEIGASLATLCWTSSISAGVIGLFIFSFSRYTITLRAVGVRLDRKTLASFSARFVVQQAPPMRQCRRKTATYSEDDRRSD